MHRSDQIKAVTAYTRFDDLPEYLTVREACKLLRRSKNAVYSAIQNGTIPHIKVGERGLLVPKKFFSVQEIDIRQLREFPLLPQQVRV